MCIKVIASQRWDVVWDTVYMFNRRFGLWHRAPSAFSSEAGTLVLGATGTGGMCPPIAVPNVRRGPCSVPIVACMYRRWATCTMRGSWRVTCGGRTTRCRWEMRWWGRRRRADHSRVGLSVALSTTSSRHWAAHVSLSRRLIHRTHSVTVLCVDVLLCASVDCVISTQEYLMPLFPRPSQIGTHPRTCPT